MKPTKMRNSLMHQATFNTKSKQLSSQLSEDLRKKYSKKNIRIAKGDSVKITRGEFKGVDGKVSRVSTEKNSVAIEGIKKEKTKGDKFDVFIHTSNLLITGLNTDDKLRIAKLEGKNSSKQKQSQKKEEPTKETKVAKNEKKEDEV
jgi:large subunit ribosomal protein L24